MPRRAPLRDATNEAPPKKPLTVTDAASIGTHKDLLVAMRARVATAVQDPNTPARDLAALTTTFSISPSTIRESTSFPNGSRWKPATAIPGPPATRPRR